MTESKENQQSLLTELEEAQRTIAALKRELTAQIECKPSSEELEEKSEERYRSFVEQSAEGIWLLELSHPVSVNLSEDEQVVAFFKESRLSDCNRVMAQMYGLSSAEEMVGARLSDLLVPSNPANIDYLKAFIRSGYKLTDAESHEVDVEGKSKNFLNNLIGIIEDGFVVRVWGTQRDITEARRIDSSLRASEARHKALLQAVPDWIFRYRKDGTYLDFSGQEEGLLFPPSAFLGKTVFEVHTQALAKQTFERIEQTLATGAIQHFEFNLPIQSEVRFYESRMAPSGTDEVVEIVRDITENKRAQAVQSGQQEILELIARGAPLPESLEALTLFVESLSVRAVCSILLLDEESQTLSHGAAPNLPAAYAEAIDGVKIGPEVGSCGTAAYGKTAYVAADIESDPHWADYKHLALPHGLRACWSTPILNESGKVLGTFAVYYKEPGTPSEQDVHVVKISTHLAGIAIERHRSETQLRESEERYRALYENNPLMVFTVDGEGTILLVNEFGAQQLGYSARELIGQSGRMLFRDEDSLAARGLIHKCLKNPTAVSEWEIQKVHKDGRLIWVKENARAVKQEDGKPAVLLVCENITWRKNSEEALRESERRYRLLFERNLAGVYRGKLDGTAIDCNEAYAQIFGYESKADFLTHTAFDVYFDLAEREAFTRLLVENGSVTNFEIRLRKKDGSPVWLLLNVTLLEDSNGDATIIEETAIDITERKLAEEALRESEAKFRSVAESTASAMTIHRDGNLLYVNPATERISGYSREELLHMNLAQILHPDSLQLYLERTLARKRGEPVPLETEYKIICKDGEERWMDFTFGGFVNIDSQLGIIGTAYDITDRKRAEELLIAEKERLSVTLRSIGDGVIATDTEGRIILINKIAENLTGWQQEEALGRHLNEVFQILNAKTRQPLEDRVTGILKTGQALELDEQLALIAKDGGERIIADSLAPIYDKEGHTIGLVLVFRDMTEELKREEESLKATKLESIALLAGGIAHDFNNILTAIMGNLSLAKRFIDPQNSAYQRLNDTEQATLRAKDLTQQLLTFSSGGAPIKKTASLARLLREGVNFALTGSNVKGNLYVQEDLWLTEIDEGQINQVIHNLVLNGRQAMPLGGSIEVRAENVELKAGSIIQGAYLPPNRYVKIMVRDPGVGISPEHLQKIFDPYFTTKQKGSGLGLATSYSIVKNHEGYLFVESELGAGTTFSIYLLASDKPAAQKITLESSPLAGRGKILIMDDEPVLRKMIGDMLKYLGYESEAAANGSEALELYRQARQAGSAFDAVILDLTVPGEMGGAEAAEKLHRLDPQVRCIVSSGYSTDPIMAEYQEHGFVAVIAKPYQIAELNEVLIRVIGKASEAN
jgi:two-component system, cell cycle sensor histidine kinase and response regulator CckA